MLSMATSRPHVLHPKARPGTKYSPNWILFLQMRCCSLLTASMPICLEKRALPPETALTTMNCSTKEARVVAVGEDVGGPYWPQGTCTFSMDVKGYMHTHTTQPQHTWVSSRLLWTTWLSMIWRWPSAAVYYHHSGDCGQTCA